MSPAGPAGPGPWPWPPALQASVALHLAAVGALALGPGMAPWAAGAVALNHLGLSAAGLWPRSRLLGPNITRLPSSGGTGTGTGTDSGSSLGNGQEQGRWALTIDDGPDAEVTPAVLDLLAEHGACATFFCIAEKAEAHPGLVQRMVREGHSVQNHTLSHRHHFSVCGPAALRREIGRAQDVLSQLSGLAPHCFRAPAGLRSPLLDSVLHSLGLHLVSWTRRGFDTRERSADRVLARLTRRLADGDILLLHDGNAARNAAGQPVLLEVLPRLLQATRGAGLRGVTLSQALTRRGAAGGERHNRAVSKPSP